MAEIEQVAEFRNRLVRYMNKVIAEGSFGYSFVPMDEAVARELAAERVWLAQTYGRLHRVINRYGTMQMGSRAFGISSHDVIADAIHNIQDSDYDTLARLSLQQLDTVIGRLQADAEQSRPSSERLYRLTSLAYWLQMVVGFIRWLIGTQRGRITAIIGAVALAIITAIVNGWAEAFFTQLLTSVPTPSTTVAP